MNVTHEVTNQPAPLVDVNLFTANLGLQDALRFNRPDFDATRFAALGAEAGSAAMQRFTPSATSTRPRPVPRASGAVMTRPSEGSSYLMPGSTTRR